MKNNLPIWIKSLTIRPVKKGLNRFWRVITYSNVFNCTTKPRIRCEYITKFYTKEEAIAQAIHNARSIYLHSRGAWIVSKVKEKYGVAKETRKELFEAYCSLMKAKYDGLNYLYESQEAQDEIILALRIPDISSSNAFKA